jgi:endonuclease/exonuclease/phosphatase family metal-dependent hydrolase
LIKSQQIYLTAKKHNPLNATVEGRVYLENKYEINGKIITIATTHLGYSHKFRATKTRLVENQNLCAILRKKIDNYIFCADLNSTKNGLIRKNISKYIKNCGPELNRPTWTTKPFDYHGFKEDQLKYRIDYVFSTNDMNISKSTIINTEFSDHLPILVEFEI